MKRLILLAVAVSSLAACVQDRSFEEVDGVCYRHKTDKVLFVIPVNQSEVQTVSSNCGVAP